MRCYNSFLCFLFLIKFSFTNTNGIISKLQNKSFTKSNNSNFSLSNKTQDEIKVITDKLFINHKNYTNIVVKLDNKDIKVFCKNHCSFHGYCLEGTCYCKPGYTGDDCSHILISEKNSECFNNCNNNGKCNDDSVCICKEGFSGIDCSIKVDCGKDEECNNNGECLNGKCQCYENYAGKHCNISMAKCKNDCNNNGKCLDGKCYCNDNYLGEDCGKNKLNCSGNGLFSIHNYTCICNEGFYGYNCEFKSCMNNCTFPNGICEKSKGICSCLSNFTGLDCSQSKYIIFIFNRKMP